MREFPHHSPYLTISIDADDQASVRGELALHCLDQLDRPLAFLATCHYAASDPWAVSLTLHLPSGDATWLLARSLLVRGLTAPAGDGAVHLWPFDDEEGCRMVNLQLRTPEGCLRVAARARHLEWFVQRTREIVPLGTERIDHDHLLRSLLG